MPKFQTLPPESQMWGREIEQRLAALEVSASNLNTLTNGTNARLSSTSATVNNLNQTVKFLAEQTYNIEASPATLTTHIANPADIDIPDTWFDFDPDADASIELTTSTTGKVAVQAGGYISAYSLNYCYTRGYIGVEILDEFGAQVRAPLNGDGNLTVVWSVNTLVTNASTGQVHQWDLEPNTLYTLRCRRGYSVGAGPSDSYSQISFQGTSLNVSLLGI